MTRVAQPSLDPNGGEAAHLHIRLPQAQRDWLFAFAEATPGLTASDIARMAIDEQLGRVERDPAEAFADTGPPVEGAQPAA